MEHDREDHPRARTRRVLVADGDLNVRNALRLLLARHPHFRVVGESQNICELLRDAQRLQPEMILLDLQLRGLRVHEHLEQLRELCVGVFTIALSTRGDQREEALAAGAEAFVCKNESPAHLLRTLRVVDASF